MEQLGYLLQAMIAVVVSGSSGLLLESAPEEDRQCVFHKKPDQVRVGAFAGVADIEFKKGGKYFGVYSRVGSLLGITASGVRMVANGRAKSQRVTDALYEERRRVDSLPCQPQEERLDLITPEERRLFSGKYSGIYKHVAATLGCSDAWVYEVARGRFYSAPVLAALRAFMSTVDGLPSLSHLTEEERAQCRRGGRYSGIYPRVAKQLGVDGSCLQSVASGRLVSRRQLAALRAEMAAIDKQVAG
jgi:hypothetical protein